MDRKRRSFLKRSLTGVAGAAVLPGCFGASKSKGESRQPTAAEPAAAPEQQPAPDSGGKTIRRVLGKTGLELPIVSIGAMNATNPALLSAALDAGVEHIDTAHVYQDGRNEEMVGSVMKGRPRESCVIATKIRGPAMDRTTHQFTADSKPEDFIADFEVSLKRLQMDYVDILYLHSMKTREATAFEPILGAMVQLKEQGKVRWLGVSTHRNEPDVIRAAIATQVYDVVLTAYNFRQPHRVEVEAAMAEAAAAGLGVVAMKTQAGVFLDEARTEKINMKAALKWALHNENVHTAIPGVDTFDQLELDLTVRSDVTLTAEEEADIARAESVAGLFCSQCGECVGECAEGLAIPELMRGYMYAYGYRNRGAARDVIDSLGLSGAPCASCSTCRVRSCPMGLQVRPRIADIARIRDVPREFLT